MKYKTISDVNKSKPKNSRYTAIEFSESIRYKNNIARMVLCRCTCGNEKVLSISTLMGGEIISCGCYSKELNKKGRYRKFHPVIPRLHNIYFQLLERCYNPKHIGYHNYGGRGVTVCDEWRYNYQNFLDWSLKNGYADNLEIDKDIKGNGLVYSPKTCSWVTRLININNKYEKYDYNGEKLTIAQIARANNITRQLLYFFVKRRGNNVQKGIELCHQFNSKKDENNKMCLQQNIPYIPIL